MGEVDDDSYTGVQLGAAAIRVLAHPLRSRLLSYLRTGGPATATELASALQTNTGATSYHLRKLESVGLVTDTGQGEGKRRLWRASTSYHSWNQSDFRDDEDALTALGWLERSYIRRLALLAEHWQDVLSEWPDEWVDPLGLNDTFVTVTSTQLRQLREELDAVLTRYRHAGDGDPAARRIQVWEYAHPSNMSFHDPDGSAPAASS